MRIREKFGFKVNDAMWQFYQSLGVIDATGKPTEHFGDPLWVYTRYLRKRGDDRTDEAIRAEGTKQIEKVQGRGLFIARGHGQQNYDLDKDLAAEIKRVYEDGKQSIWSELTDVFSKTVPDRFDVTSKSKNREDYILHPASGEKISDGSLKALGQLRTKQKAAWDTQIVISDGLNADSIMDDGHLIPFLKRVRAELESNGFKVAPDNVLVRSGRVRTGYRIGETLFAKTDGRRNLLHIIGERPGSGHHTFSVYLTSALSTDWEIPDTVDHNITKVVSGIAVTALDPKKAAHEVVSLLASLS